MNEVYVRTTSTFSDVNGGWDNINSYTYSVAGPFDPSLGELCATMTNFTDSEIRELYCRKILRHRYVVLHTTGPILQFCEIEVNRYNGNLNHNPRKVIIQRICRSRKYRNCLGAWFGMATSCQHILGCKPNH